MATGKCDDFVAPIMDYIDGELSGKERQRLLEHLRQCERCASQAQKLRLLRLQLRSLPGCPPHLDLMLDCAPVSAGKSKCAGAECSPGPQCCRGGLPPMRLLWWPCAWRPLERCSCSGTAITWR